MYNRRPNLHIAEGLATAALVGHWAADDMASRFASALNLRSRRKWLTHLVARIFGRFGSVPPPPSLFRLSRFILHDAAFEKVVQQLSAVQERLWESDSALKAALNLNDLLHEILPHMNPHEAAHAFRAGCSTATGAAPHIGRRIVLRIDLREFYPSIHSGRVQGVFRTLGYPEPVARLLTGLCTNTVPAEILADEFPAEIASVVPNGLSLAHLPQGAPTSPALANLCSFRLDCRLAGLARTMEIHYTRYADDLIFSGGREFERNLSRFRVFVCAIVLNEGFAIRRRKTRVMRSGCRQEVTGIVVNQRLNVPRDEFDRLKAILHNCATLGPQDQNREGHRNFREHLRGRIAYVQMIHAAKGERLQAMFERINWSL